MLELDRCLKGCPSESSEDEQNESVHDILEDKDNFLYMFQVASEDIASEDESSVDNERLHKRLRQSFAGSDAYHKKMENVPPGPATVAGFANFPKTLCGFEPRPVYSGSRLLTVTPQGQLRRTWRQMFALGPSNPNKH